VCLRIPALAAILAFLAAPAVDAQQQQPAATIQSLESEIDALRAEIATLQSEVAAIKTKSAAIATSIKARLIARGQISV
jgi:septal ring factor EnvC (AmiA/AmiB activator)